MSSKQIHYNIDNIKEKNALINLIYGEKSNGKSYQAKHKLAILNYINNNKRFILLRRWKDDINNTWIERYFADVDIETLTNKKYTFVSMYRKALYFSNMDETGKTIRGEKIGYALPLSAEQHFSSGSFLDVDTIIFEEFMQRGIYIKDEPEKLMIFYSTVDRKRGTTKLWLIGNTISRVCPYLNDWGLHNVVRNLKQGQIETLEIVNDTDTIKMAIEYCQNSGGKKVTIGNASSMIESGAWQTKPQPKIENIKDYKILFKVGFLFKGFKFIGQYMYNIVSRETIWYIYPYTRHEFKNKMLVFSDIVKNNMLWFRNPYEIVMNNKKVESKYKKLFDTFRESNIFYSDDLTGTDFKQAIDFSIKK